MFDFKLVYNDLNEVSQMQTRLSGQDLLSCAKLNKGCAFTEKERELFQLTGLLPTHIETLEQQVLRMYMQYSEHQTNLAKNIYLNMLHDYNETLFYKLISEHLEEMLPIVYTPTVGEAVQHFSLEHRRPKGLYVSYQDGDHIDDILNNRIPPEVDLTVVTDGGAVLGIGDQGIGGINISSAKLMVYTLCGGIHPHRVLPVQLDVGTNNPHLLNDPMYLGWRHERIEGQQYIDFVDAFVQALTKKFPNIFIHWEDIGRDNARIILSRYRQQFLTMNGDMQATAVVALASVLAGVSASSIPLQDHRIVIFGAGNAGAGIAEQIYAAMLREGMSKEDALSRLWLIDKHGLLTEQAELMPFQAPFARKMHEIADWNKDEMSLLDVIHRVHPTILIGCSTAAGAFNEEMIRTMAKHVSRPIILPLSNPTALSEAKPADLLAWTNGKAIIATGSPFPDVFHDNKKFRIAQSNNALAFPGIGLGVISSKAKLLSDDMLWAATQALKEYSPINQDILAPLLPKINEVKMVSMHIALAVAEQARQEGLAGVSDKVDLKQLIKQTVWEPKYFPYTKGVA